MKKGMLPIVREAFEATPEEFIRLADEVTQLLARENENAGSFNVKGRLIELEPIGETIVASDIHGSIESLVEILKETKYLLKTNKDFERLPLVILLGDYGDRGAYSTEVYHLILKLKLQLPDRLILMRGNHEGPEDLIASPHDLPMHLRTRFGRHWKDAYSSLRRLFEHLYSVVLVDGLCLMIHGGLPPHAAIPDDLAYAHTEHPKNRVLEDILWSDPTEMLEETCESPRGAGRLFGNKVTDDVLRRFRVKFLIRGHEACTEGFKLNHRGRVLTLFSRKGPPYFNAKGAFLRFNFSQKPESAKQLLPFIRQF